MQQISTEVIKATLVAHGFEDTGECLVYHGPTEFRATVAPNHLSLSFSSTGTSGSYDLDILSPCFGGALGELMADGRMRARAAGRHRRM